MALFGIGAPDHPMAGIRQAKKLVADLPVNDSVKALDEVIFWLDSIRRTEGFKVDYRFELIDLLDRTAKGHPRKLAQDYLATDRQEKFRESKLWNTVFNFWKQLGDAYGQCVAQFQSGASGAGAIRKKLPTIVARALRAVTLQLKWSLLHYGPVEDRLWGELGQLYLFAEAQRITIGTIEIYPGAHGQGTVQQEFLKAMMLGVSSTGGLTPLKQEIAETTRIVAQLLQGTLLDHGDMVLTQDLGELFGDADGTLAVRALGQNRDLGNVKGIGIDGS